METLLFIVSMFLMAETCISQLTDAPDLNVTEDDASETAKDKKEPDWRAIIIAFCAGILCLVGSCVAMGITQWVEVRATTRRDKQKEEIYQREQIRTLSPHPPLLAAMQIKDILVRSVYIPSVLSESTMQRLGGKDLMIQAYVRFLSEIDSSMVDGQLRSLPSSLHPEIRARCDTQVSVTVNNIVRYFNLNKLTDFVGGCVLLGQPPATRADLDPYWKAIWENKIGCLVWIGNVHCVGDRKMWFEAYAPVDVWKTEDAVWRLGDLEIKVSESFIQKDPKSHFIHRIRVTKKTAGRAEHRHISVVHIDPWEDVRARAFDWDPRPAFIKKITDALSYTHYALYKKPKKGEIPLQNLLVNCPTGVHQSVTFTILHICRQMWLFKDKARVEAVVKYVRQHRYLAWGTLTENQLFSELKVVYRTMKMIMEQYDEQERRQKHAKAEADLEQAKKKL